MKNMNKITRRNFLSRVSVGAGAALTLGSGLKKTYARTPKPATKENRLPREVWIASITHGGLEAGSYQEMLNMMLKRMDEVAPFQPDIVCLPEVFPFMRIPKRPPLSEIAEEPLGPISEKTAEYAKKNNCYVVCPIYTKEDGSYYNSAVIIDRKSGVVGEYRKIHPTISETKNGIVPGPVEPPVFDTDFGKIGAQICYDINWHDAWKRMKKSGAEIVFWPSAFNGGKMLGALAWMNKYCVVSSTRFDPARICDIDGSEVVSSGLSAHWVCAPINLEKAFIHSWPYRTWYKDVRKKYGNKIRIKLFHEEEWSIIESRSPDVRVADVLKEFEILTHEEHIARAEIIQDKCRK